MKKVIIDKYIPHTGNPFEGVAEVVSLDPQEITRDTVADADALIVRTRTRCDASLLQGSKVSMVATATIGTDHLDLPWLAQNGIRTVSAPGCNAPAVAQWVLSSILTLGLGQPGMRLGVVGMGHVGSIVARWAEALGMDVLPCDPLIGRPDYLTWREVARRTDVVTFHTPLTKECEHATYHLLGRDFLDIAPKAMILNSSRGAVADTRALVEAAKHGRVDHLAIDTWEAEPNISADLLRLSEIATPHIAGYSLQGKQRATAVTFNAVLSHLGSERRIDTSAIPPTPQTVTPAQILDSYHPLTDTEMLKRSPGCFESLRNHYPLRHEVK